MSLAISRKSEERLAKTFHGRDALKDKWLAAKTG